jgi:hypothetical protein
MLDIDPGSDIDALKPGDEVLIVSNNISPWVGRLKGWTKLPGGQHPVITSLLGKDFVVFGIVFPSTPELQEMFDGLFIKEAWELARKISMLIQTVHRKAHGDR